MAYSFKLQTLLNYRQTLEEQAQLKLAKEQQQLVLQENRLAELQQRRLRTIDALEQRKKTVMPASLFTYFMDSLLLAEKAIAQQRESIAAQKKIIDRLRSELVEKMRQRKVIDRLRDRDHTAYLLESLRKELKENDEQALLARSDQDSLLRQH